VKVAIGQFGAPTTVLNASLFGVLEGFDGHAQTYGVFGGVSGLISGDLHPLNDISRLHWLLDTPGAALAAGRYGNYEEAVDAAVQTLKKAQVDALVLLGGNGTMSFGAAIEAKAKSRGYPLSVIGVPKTIDNDIPGIAHSPGFPSAARFVLQAVRDLQVDLEAMTGFEQVRIVEVMGRRCGWLTAAASLLPYLGWDGRQSLPKVSPAVLRPIICIPEKPLDTAVLMHQIESRVKAHGNALVVVSEGVLDVHGEPVMQSGQATSSASGVLGGIGAVLSAKVRDELGFGSRYENLGLLQRCWRDCSLQSDKHHARRLGQLGAKALLAGRGGVMMGLTDGQKDVADDQMMPVEVPLKELAGQERRMTGDALYMGEDFVRWLGPLVEIHTMTEYPRLATALRTQLIQRSDGIQRDEIQGTGGIQGTQRR
jgi:ATP-dependent phosphofructokinase / diphosphate-dependent phosphofructokinase